MTSQPQYCPHCGRPIDPSGHCEVCDVTTYPARDNKVTDRWVWIAIAGTAAAILMIVIINLTATTAIDNESERVSEIFDEIASEL